MEIKRNEDKNQESYEVSFSDENGNDIQKLENNIMIIFL